MSYEGYTEFMCRKGHAFTKDAYEALPESCGACGDPIVWAREVDVTNGEDPADPGTLPSKLRIKEQAKYETCPTCGHRELTEEALYHVPEDQGRVIPQGEKQGDGRPGMGLVPPPDILAGNVVGRTKEEAVRMVETAGCVLRVTVEDGNHFVCTRDYRTDRINVNVEGGVVKAADVG